MATQFSTPRHAARRIGAIPSVAVPFVDVPPIPPAVEDHRFTSPRGAAATTARSTSSNSELFDFSTPRHENTSYSSDEREDDTAARPPPRPTLALQPQRSYYKDIAFAKPVKPVDVFSLVRHNRVDDVKTVLDNGLPVDITDENGNTLLIIACQNGLKRLTKELLRRGANINACNKRRNTPLHFCFAYGYGETLGAYLISKGADVTLTNDDGLECYYGIEPPQQMHARAPNADVMGAPPPRHRPIHFSTA